MGAQFRKDKVRGGQRESPRVVPGGRNAYPVHATAITTTGGPYRIARAALQDAYRCYGVELQYNAGGTVVLWLVVSRPESSDSGP